MDGCSMRGIGFVVALILLCAPCSVVAQLSTLPTRQELDSLVNPALSQHAAGALWTEQECVDLGAIKTQELIKFSFELHNSTKESITITQFRPSCSCITVLTKPTVVEPNSTLSVVAQFNPKGRSSSFKYTILIYTSLDSRLPSQRVTIMGDVQSSDKWHHLPERAGALRLSRKSVVIESSTEERIAVANSSDRDIEPTAQSTIAGLSLRCEPQVLAPHAEGDIVISYNGELTAELNTMLILEGIEATPSEKMIRVTIKR